MKNSKLFSAALLISMVGTAANAFTSPSIDFGAKPFELTQISDNLLLADHHGDDHHCGEGHDHDGNDHHCGEDHEGDDHHCGEDHDHDDDHDHDGDDHHCGEGKCGHG